MEQWKGKVAVVTGASSGIGVAIAKELCRHEVIVVGMARRVDRLDQVKQEIMSESKRSSFYPVKCDFTIESDIVAAFKYVEETLGGVDIMINNAGMVKLVTVLEGDLSDFKNTIDLNLLAVISSAKKAYKSMVDRDAPGYIINVCSVAGYSVVTIPGLEPVLNVYPATKHALRALNTTLRYELNFYKQNKIRVSNISPGAVKSEMTDFLPRDLPMLEAEDIAETVIYMLGTSPRVQVEDVIIRPAGEMF